MDSSNNNSHKRAVDTEAHNAAHLIPTTAPRSREVSPCSRGATATAPRLGVSDHDHLSVRVPSRTPSQRSVAMTADANGGHQGAGGGTAQQRVQQKHVHRKLILCFDGTGNKFHGDDSDSNILKIFRMLDRTANDQYHYYQPGIGTYVVSSSLSHTSLRARFRSWYMKAKDSAVGSSFDQHVVGGYRFLMRFYCPGDEIFIFGFSRGAYIARFLAEMLDYIGLLSHGNEEMVAFAWKAFSQWQCRRTANADDAIGQRKKREMYEFMRGFRETFSRPVRRIRFLGLFDTVNSVPRFETAWMERSKFPYTARSSAKVIRHAVSIDERRAKFRQDLMYQSEFHRRKSSHHHHHHHHHHPHPIEEMGDMMHEIHEKYRRRSSATLAFGTNGQPLNRPRPSTAGESEDRGRRPSQIGKLNVPTVPEEDEAGEGSNGTYPTPYRAHSRSKSRATRSKSRATRATAETSSDYSELAPFDDGDTDPEEMNDEDFESEDETQQDIDEVWFAGGHGDVGGGWAVEAGTKSTSHVPLVWMVREAMRAGLKFDIEKVVAMGCSEALGDPRDDPRYHQQDTHRTTTTIDNTTVPDIRVDGTTPPDSPGKEEKNHIDRKDHIENDDNDNDDNAASSSPFHQMMHKAHVARMHDSLQYDCGLGFISVFSWKLMEYMPFRRMDLQTDGTWKPIRWPLPCGEVRDIPSNVRVHGSVIRRMRRDAKYRPGNLIVGGGGRGCRVAPEKYGMGEWECVDSPGDPVSEVWKKKVKSEEGQ